MTDARAACPGRVGVVPPAGQRRHQLGPPGAGAPRRSRGTRPSWSPRPAPRRTPASRCTPPAAHRCRSTGTSGIGLETRARLRAEMLRFRPDVVHIASPATLGLQAARAAEELGIPSVAIYQTDLIGFAERYAAPGSGRRHPRDGLPDPPDPHPRRPHPGAVDGQPAPARGRWRPAAGAVAARRRPRRASTPGSATRGCAGSSPRTAGCWSGTSAGSRPRRSSSCSPTSPATPATRWWSSEGARGGPAPAAAARRPLPRRAARRRARPRVRLAGRVRAHRPARDLLPVRPGGARLRRPRRRAALRRPDRRGRTTAWPASSTSPATATTSAATSTGWPATPSSAAGWAAPRGAGRGPLVAGGQRGAGRALPRGRGDHDRLPRAGRLSQQRRRPRRPGRRGARGPPWGGRGPATRSSGQAGRVSVQYARPTRTIAATEDSSA